MATIALEDTAIVLDEVAIVTSMDAASRREELAKGDGCATCLSLLVEVR